MKHKPPLLCHRGQSYPLGSTPMTIANHQGVNYALMSRHATAVTLCLFDDDGEERRVRAHKSGDIWHVFVADSGVGQHYGWRVDGENHGGGRFNPRKLLLDPYAKAIDRLPQYRDADELARYHHDDPRDNAAVAPKSIVVGDSRFDWEDDTPPRTPWKNTIIYEAHVKGFSRQNPAIPRDIAGTFAGMAHPASIDYLKTLGITAVELLPVSQHLDEIHLQQRGMSNYWGYNVYAHNIPDKRYGSADDLKHLVKTLHRAGIEIILDVVYNHSAEQDIYGPTLCQRGIDNQHYYWLNDHGDYINHTGCGNAVNLAHPEIMQWVLDSLRYWVREYHIDGFRFDLCTTLGRTPAFDARAGFFTAIQQDPELAGIKMIAEPWDIGPDGYNLGQYPARFSEWNGRFRDDMRGFWLWENGWLGALAQRISGSDDIFRHDWREAHSSINYLTAHDGFTLHDLVSYSYKHNEANGEANRDGDNHNYSWNHGVEGESDDPAIQTERLRSRKAMLASLLLAQGVPMLLSGDERGHSQHGNNNSYCQDNPTTWIDWQHDHPELREHIRALIVLRQQLAADGVYDDWWHRDNARWYNANGEAMCDADWHNEASKALVLELQDKYLILFNANRGEQHYTLPAGDWQPLLGDGLKQPNPREANLAHMSVSVLQKTQNGTNPNTLTGAHP